MNDVPRNNNGTFKPGYSGNPNGRAPKAREIAYLQIAKEVVTLERWRGIIAQAVNDALGIKVVERKLVSDPESTGASRNAARTFLRDTLLGKPAQSIHIRDQETGYDEFAHLSDDELRAIIANADAPDDVQGFSDAELQAIAQSAEKDEPQPPN